jgi:hypothetical protein
VSQTQVSSLLPREETERNAFYMLHDQTEQQVQIMFQSMERASNFKMVDPNSSPMYFWHPDLTITKLDAPLSARPLLRRAEEKFLPVLSDAGISIKPVSTAAPNLWQVSDGMGQDVHSHGTPPN